jgi:hypothetical protein
MKGGINTMLMQKEKFKQASSFIKTKARPLERALFQYEFENGRKEDVILELEKFQNDDGGFGNSLEPDFRLGSSSALATSVALQTISYLKIEPNHSIVQKVMNYLINTYNPDSIGWEMVPKEVEKVPRAPWWNYQEPRKDWGNPNAEILGYFYEYKELIPESLLQTLTEKAIHHFNNLEEYEFHEVLCYVRLAERIDSFILPSFIEKLKESLKICVEKDKEKWREYTLQPIQVVQSPTSMFYPYFEDVIEENLKFILEIQTEKGSWEPTWSWFGQYMDTWETAKVEWEGVLTLGNLRTLKSFQLINL